MKERNPLFTSLLLALTACIQTTQAVQLGELRAPIPQFMNQEQLGQWSAEQKTTKVQNAQPAETSARHGIQFFYSDTFTDPLDLIQLFYGTSTSPNAPGCLADAVNLGGTAFQILDVWSQTFSGDGVYE